VDRLHTFTVPVEPTVPPAETVYRLEGIAGLPAGPGSEIGGRGTPRLLPVGELDRIPRTVFRRTPSYPEPERRDGIAGAVTVEFVVDTAGRVLRAEAVAWTRREFVEPSVRAVQDWRFEPGTVRGRKVSFRMAVPIEFTATP
jgi:TonB family protein